MYIQPHFSETRVEALHKLMREYPLGTLVSHGDRGVEANHIPFLLDTTASPIKLCAHIPRANAVWKELNEQTSLVIFHGPNAYISPSWYPSKAAHGKAVPTWNYAVVHVYGVARIIEDKMWLRNHLETMTATHERNSKQPWKLSDAPSEYIDKMLNAIVGLEISASRIEGKFKLGQNKSVEDRQSVMKELIALDSPLVGFGS